jgi:hypothetical protein
MKAFPRSTPALRLGLAALLALAAPFARSASHRDAPGILSDPDANHTDLFAFVTGPIPGGTGNTVTFAMNWHPFIDPDEGPIWTYPSPDVLYEIQIENDAKMVNGAPVFTGKPNISYQFRFSRPAFQNNQTFLTEGRGTGLDAGPINDVGDAHQNLIQFYTVTRKDLATGAQTSLTPGKIMLVPPPNVGKAATPFYNDANGFALPGATSDATLDKYTKEASYTLNGGRRVFVGMREDPFYFDQGGTFDLLSLRNPGIDTFAGLNVLSCVLQVPISDVVATGPNAVPIIGVFSTNSRRQVTIRRGASSSFNGGVYMPVSRMGNPVFNEALVPLEKKDRYNQTMPDGDEGYRTYAENPELAVLINAVVLHSNDPVSGPIKTSGRTDLSGIYIPDLLKLDTTTPPVPLAGQQGFSRLSVFGGDTVNSAFQGKAVPSGWPNGRRIGDDVIDIALTAIGSQGALPANTILGDNVDGNDVTYPTVFPYLGVPHSATNHKHHGTPPPAP